MKGRLTALGVAGVEGSRKKENKREKELLHGDCSAVIVGGGCVKVEEGMGRQIVMEKHLKINFIY